MEYNNITGANLQTYAVNEHEHIVDTRPFAVRTIYALRDYKKAKKIIISVFFTMCAMSILPFANEVILFVIFPLIWYFAIRDLKTRVYDFPSAVPQSLDRFDGSEPTQGDAKQKGLGNLFFGSVRAEEYETKLPIVSSFLNGIKHIIISGTTKSGKTETLYAIFYNALLTQNGLHFVDGKGALDAFIRTFEMARRFGREDDMLLTNFKVDKTTSSYDKKSVRPLSNSYDIFRTQSPATLNETLRSFLAGASDGGSGGDNSMWVDRASSLISGLTRPLMYLAEKGHENLTIRTFIDHMSVEKIEELLFDKTKQYGPEFKETTRPLMEFMVSTNPNYNESMRGQLPFDSLKQFMFASMQLNRTQSEFTYNFGNIFDILVGDIEPEDVVRNKRIWVSTLPSVEYSFSTIRLLGRMQIESARQALAAMMVGSPSGNTRKIMYEMNQMSNRWFVEAFDEFAYFGTDGTSILPAQGRAYGMCMVFSLQEMQSLHRMGSEEAVETVSNTAIKIFMRTSAHEDSSSWQTIKGFLGTIDVTVSATLKSGRRVFRKQQVSQEQKTITVPRATYKMVSTFQDGEMVYIYPKRIQNKTPDAGVTLGRSMYVPPAKGKGALQSVTVHQFLPIEPYVKSQVGKIAFAKLSEIKAFVFSDKFMGEVESALNSKADSEIEKQIDEFDAHNKEASVYASNELTDIELFKSFITTFNQNDNINTELNQLRKQLNQVLSSYSLGEKNDVQQS